MSRQTIATGSRYEELMGYARAVVVNGIIYVSGCSGLPPDIDTNGPGDAAAQLAYAAVKVGRILEQAGATLADVVRTRLYLTDETDWDALVEAHGLAFGAVRPACTMVQVSRLIDPRMKIELEVTAVLSSA
jgi:enamine deaminase RidA (YjgF/YER057c/UK114 family)